MLRDRSLQLLLASLPLVVSAQGVQSPYLDPSFGNSGMTTGTLSEWDGAGVLKADPANGGFFLFCAHRAVGGMFPVEYYLIKYTSNGQPDANFNSGNPVYITELERGLYVPVEASMTVQADGKPVITGMSTGFPPKLRAQRFTTDGQPDGSFGPNGVFELNTGSGYHTGIGIAQDANGRLVCAGFYNTSILDPERQAIVARVLDNGTLDPSFGGTGWIYYDQFDGTVPSDEQARVPVPLSTGDILIGGSYDDDLDSNKLYVMRVDPSGAPVGSFGNGGAFTTGSANEEYLTAMEVDEANANIHLGVWDDPNGGSDLVVDRIGLASGQYVTGFGTNGRARKNMGSAKAAVHSVAQGANGNIYAGGYVNTGADSTAIICRFSDAGVWDPTWLGDGIDTTTTIGATYGMAYTTEGLFVAGLRNQPKDHFLAKYGNSVLGVDDTDARTVLIDVFPNPTSGLVLLRTTARTGVRSMRIIDASGREVGMVPVVHSVSTVTLDMHGYENGLYFLHVEYTDGARATACVVKE